jgi:hypothetical protein
LEVLVMPGRHLGGRLLTRLVAGPRAGDIRSENTTNHD